MKRHCTLSRRARIALPLLIVGSLTTATAALAEATPEQIAAARTLGRAGVAEAELGECDAAIAKLTRAEALYHAPTTAAPLGECQIRLGRIVAGTETLNKLVHEQLPPTAPPSFLVAQQKARDALAQALPRIAKLRVHVSAPPGAGSFEVSIDREPLSVALLDQDRPTDPGAHTVRASAPGCVSAEQSVTLEQGEAQLVTLSLSFARRAAPSPAPAPDADVHAVEPTAPRADAHGVRTHDGFYFRAGLGAALFASGTITPTGSNVDASVSGAGPSLELAFGGTVYSGLVVGGGIYGMSAPGPSYSANGATLSGGSAIVSSIGPFGDWYVDPKQGVHIQAAIGLATIAASKGTPTKIGGSTYTFPSSDQSGTGVSLLAGVGYEWWVGDQLSFGLLARLQYVTGSVKGANDSQSTSVKVVVPALLATLTYQ